MSSLYVSAQPPQVCFDLNLTVDRRTRTKSASTHAQASLVARDSTGRTNTVTSSAKSEAQLDTRMYCITCERILILITHSSDVYAATQITLPPKQCPAHGEHLCDANDGCLYTAHGEQFIVKCNYDLYGGDLLIAQTPDFGSCIIKCADTNQCVAVTFWGGTCYLKSEKRPAEFNSKLQSAFLSSLE